MYSGTVSESDLQQPRRFADYVAETYPFCIKFVGDTVVAYNAITGEDVGPRHPFTGFTDGSFELAHRAAEEFAEAAKASQVEKEQLDAKLRAERSQPMEEYTFLVPLTRDDTKQPHAASLWNELHRTLLERFGGYTATKSGCELSGVWKTDDGDVIFDQSVEFRVAVASPGVLMELLPRLAAEFGQQCLYVKQSSPAARLVYAD